MPLHDGGHVRGVSLGNGRNGRRTGIPVDPLRAGSPSGGQYKHGFQQWFRLVLLPIILDHDHGTMNSEDELVHSDHSRYPRRFLLIGRLTISHSGFAVSSHPSNKRAYNIANRIIGAAKTHSVLYCNHAVTAPLRRFEENSSTRRLSYLDVQCTVRHRYYPIPVHVSVRAAPDIASYHIVETRIAFGYLAVDGSSDQIRELHADAVM